MEWKSYLQERVNSAPALAKEYTENAPFERTVLFRILKFVNSFIEYQQGSDARIIILYGLRGIGKSTLLFQIYNRMRSGKLFGFGANPAKQVPQENILYLP